MNAHSIFLKTAASLAVIASFGMAQAQTPSRTDETIRQTQQPGTGTGTTMQAPTQRTDETVRQTQQPSSGNAGAARAPATRTDETITQTQGTGAQHSGSAGMAPDGRRQGTTNSNNVGMGGNTPLAAPAAPMTGSSSTGMDSSNMSNNRNLSNNRMGNERPARADRN